MRVGGPITGPEPVAPVGRVIVVLALTQGLRPGLTYAAPAGLETRSCGLAIHPRPGFPFSARTVESRVSQQTRNMGHPSFEAGLRFERQSGPSHHPQRVHIHDHLRARNLLL